MTVVPRDGNRLTHATRKARFLGELLSDNVGLETPDAAAIFELRTRVNPGRARTTIRNLAGIRRKADVDVHVARIVECDVLLRVTAADRKSIDDDFRRTRGFQLTWCQLEASNMCNGCVVKVAVSQFESGAADSAELLADDVSFAVAVGI